MLWEFKCVSAFITTLKIVLLFSSIDIECVVTGVVSSDNEHPCSMNIVITNNNDTIAFFMFLNFFIWGLKT